LIALTPARLVRRRKYLCHVVPVLYGCGKVSMEFAEGIRSVRKGDKGERR
jgi:hypothetical protein